MLTIKTYLKHILILIHLEYHLTEIKIASACKKSRKWLLKTNKVASSGVLMRYVFYEIP